MKLNDTEITMIDSRELVEQLLHAVVLLRREVAHLKEQVALQQPLIDSHEVRLEQFRATFFPTNGRPNA